MLAFIFASSFSTSATSSSFSSSSGVSRSITPSTAATAPESSSREQQVSSTSASSLSYSGLCSSRCFSSLATCFFAYSIFFRKISTSWAAFSSSSSRNCAFDTMSSFSVRSFSTSACFRSICSLCDSISSPSLDSICSVLCTNFSFSAICSSTSAICAARSSVPPPVTASFKASCSSSYFCWTWVSSVIALSVSSSASFSSRLQAEALCFSRAVHRRIRVSRSRISLRFSASKDSNRILSCSSSLPSISILGLDQSFKTGLYTWVPLPLTSATKPSAVKPFLEGSALCSSKIATVAARSSSSKTVRSMPAWSTK
mmetsp:Transcript_6081/g.15019  ORF Transcript_6081/g.15019 Transcript_6081/m.15019 type:complete len:314 (+) Transcript_6081:645-1586(+)